MKILHTADWHMNTTLGRQDLSSYIVKALEQIAVYLEQYEVDVLIVAGDLFSERSRDEGMRQAIAQIHRVFGAFVARGGTILAVAGNHDSELRFETMRDALRLGSGNGMGRFVLTANPQFLVLTDKAGLQVQFALLPYPTPRSYLPGISFSTIEEKNRLVQKGFAEALQEMRENRFDPNLPAVLVSHIHVRGANSHSLYKISESDDVVFEPSQIPTEWTYAAYGHIHKPGEAIAGVPHVRYSGSVTPLDAAERFDHKGVVLVEIGPQGERTLQILPLPLVSLHQITLDFTTNTPEAELAKWQSIIPDAAEALVHTTLRYRPQEYSGVALRAQVEKLFPRWYGRSEEKVGMELAPRPLEVGAETEQPANPLSGDVPSLVRDYLRHRLSEHDEREAILGLAEELLATVRTS
jgi:exonuclease SbcD